jgi:uncharacterized MAPEG superfamily protein
MHALSVAIYAMLAASVLPFLTAGLAKALGRFKLQDNHNPRDFQKNLTGIAARAQAAQMNGYETLPVFLAAVLMAEYMVVNQHVINQLAWTYVLLRIFYIVTYLADLATLRSIIWILGFICPVLLLYLAASAG